MCFNPRCRLPTLLILVLINSANAQNAAPATQPAEPLSPAEFTFQQTLTNATLAGRFSLDGDPNPHSETYTIASVRKMKGDLWLFDAQIRYGAHQLNIPLVLPVKWAGDTPIISVTDAGIPGLGTFTARVVIYDDHYAGAWSGGPTHRGTLAGQITHPTTRPAAEASPAAPVAPSDRPNP